VGQIILLSRWFNKKTWGKNPIRKINQKDLVKMVRYKMTCPKWHFGQVGHGGKKPYGGCFLLKFLVKKVVISCSDGASMIKQIKIIKIEQVLFSSI
jgi:hypothetical protein